MNLWRRIAFAPSSVRHKGVKTNTTSHTQCVFTKQTTHENRFDICFVRRGERAHHRRRRSPTHCWAPNIRKRLENLCLTWSFVSSKSALTFNKRCCGLKILTKRIETNLFFMILLLIILVHKVYQIFHLKKINLL